MTIIGTLTNTQVEKSDSCQYFQTAQYRASCKQGAMPVLVPDSWYRAEGWRGTGMVQPQSWDQVLTNNRILSNASTDMVTMPSTAPVPMDNFQPSYFSEPRCW